MGLLKVELHSKIPYTRWSGAEAITTHQLHLPLPPPPLQGRLVSPCLPFAESRLSQSLNQYLYNGLLLGQWGLPCSMVQAAFTTFAMIPSFS